jgi:hypothetical protein
LFPWDKGENANNSLKNDEKSSKNSQNIKFLCLVIIKIKKENSALAKIEISNIFIYPGILFPRDKKVDLSLLAIIFNKNCMMEIHT